MRISKLAYDEFGRMDNELSMYCNVEDDDKMHFGANGYLLLYHCEKTTI